jgi:CspA family cold shock protein
MQEGTVKFFNEAIWFGFIKPADGSAEVFVHVTGLIDKINQDDQVIYVVQDGK